MARRRALLIGIGNYHHAPPLLGCHHDVFAMTEVLSGEKYGFDVEVVRDPIRAELDSAMDRFLDATAPGDTVVFYYSGHGSFIADPASGQRFESIVPADSGRGANPNRDLFDLEIDDWRRRLEAKAPNLTLIFDACHSGHVTRAGDDARQLIDDRRPPAELLQRLRQLDRRRGEAPSESRAVVLAACHAFELAGEHLALREELREGSRLREIQAARFFGIPFGAFTFHLHLALAAAGEAGKDVTWGPLMRQVASQVRRRRRRQNPRLIGDPDRRLFGLDELARQPYLRVVEVADDEVVLAGGTAHGLRAGSRWQVRTRSARSRDEGSLVAEVEARTVEATRCRAQIVERANGQDLKPTQHAFLLRQPVDARRLRIAIDPQAPQTDELRRALDRPGLELVTGENVADVGIVPAAEAGFLWAAVDVAGALAVRQRPQPGDGDGLSALAADLESLARHDALLRLEAPVDDPLGSLVSFDIARVRPWRQPFVAHEGELVFSEGEEIELLISNHHDAPVWLNLAQFDSNAEISLLLPDRKHSADPPPGQRLGPGEKLRLPGDYWGRPAQDHGYRQEIPRGFPWGLPGDQATVCRYVFRLFVTLEPADLRFLEQDAVRGALDHPLEKLLAFHARGPRRGGDAPDEDAQPTRSWTLIEREIVIRRDRG